MNHHQIDMLKSTLTSDGEEPLSLPGHPEFNGPSIGHFCSILQRPYTAVHLQCLTIYHHECQPGLPSACQSSNLNGLTVAHFKNSFNALRGVQGVHGHPFPTNRGCPWSFWTFFKKYSEKCPASLSLLQILTSYDFL